MPFTSEAIVPCTSSSNKISPVDTDLPLAETESLEPKGPEVDQDLVELARELSKNSGSEEPGSSRSQGRTEVDVGAKELEQLSQEGLDNLATEAVGVLPEDVQPHQLKGSGKTEVASDSNQPKSQELASRPIRGGYIVTSSSSDTRSDDSSGYQGEGYDAHQLKVAVTPDGKVITGKCLTYEDGRGGTLANNFFVNELHYSSANPDYHKRRRGLNRCGTGGCTVT